MRILDSSIVVAIVLTVGCGRNATPTSPSPTGFPAPTSPPIVSFAGAWHGTFTLIACAGRAFCHLQLGNAQAFSLRVDQTGADVSGVFHTDAWEIPVTGTVASTGELTLSGFRPAPGVFSASAELKNFTARRREELLDVELTYELRYPDSYPLRFGTSRVQSFSGKGTDIRRGGEVIPSSFTGTWVGSTITRDCSPANRPGCWPEELGGEGRYRLIVEQVGSRVFGILGEVQPLEVTGTVSGDTLSLDELTTEKPEGSGRSVFRLNRWTVTRDRVGNLTGNFESARETHYPPSMGLAPYVVRYAGDIVSGVLIH